MSEKTYWVAGDTTTKSWTLKSGDDAVNVTGGTLVLVVKDRDGTSVTTSGDTAIVTAASGIVSYTPDAVDLPAAGSPYTATWQVTISGEQRSFPEDAPLLWIVRDA